MKVGKALLAVLFSAGLAIGFLFALLVPWPQTWNQFSEQYAFDVIEQVMLASDLHAGKHDQIRQRIESQIPGYVLALHRDPGLRSSQLADPLVVIKTYYFKHQIPIPVEIRAILDEVPEADFCVIPKN